MFWVLFRRKKKHPHLKTILSATAWRCPTHLLFLSPGSQYPRAGDTERLFSSSHLQLLQRLNVSWYLGHLARRQGDCFEAWRLYGISENFENPLLWNVLLWGRLISWEHRSYSLLHSLSTLQFHRRPASAMIGGILDSTGNIHYTQVQLEHDLETLYALCKENLYLLKVATGRGLSCSNDESVLNKNSILLLSSLSSHIPWFHLLSSPYPVETTSLTSTPAKFSPL